MKRMTREDLHLTIAIGLSVLKPYQRTHSGLSTALVREEIATMLVTRIMGRPESEAVILRPDSVGIQNSTRPGVWGVDEPHPLDVIAGD